MLFSLDRSMRCRVWFFFSSRSRHTRWSCDWSSDVCSSDLDPGALPDPDEVKKIARLLREADRPAVIAGVSVWWAHAEDDVKRLIEGAHLPTNVNGMARGVLPSGHPLFFPRARGKALGEADLILVIGAQLDFRLNWGQPP